MPEELKARTDTRGEASLRGHLKAEGDEQTGSQSYIPPDPKDEAPHRARSHPRHPEELGLPAESQDGGPTARRADRTNRTEGAIVTPIEWARSARISDAPANNGRGLAPNGPTGLRTVCGTKGCVA